MNWSMSGSHVFSFINSFVYKKWIYFYSLLNIQDFICIFCRRVRVYSLHVFNMVFYIDFMNIWFAMLFSLFVHHFMIVKTHCKIRSMNFKQTEIYIYIAFILVVKYRINWIYNYMKNTDISSFLCFCRTKQTQALLYLFLKYILH